MENKAAETTLNKDDLLKTLNGLMAEEWLSHYQYWLAAKVFDGPMKSEIERVITQLASHELHHASLIAGRIVQLGGTPLLDPREWFENATFEYKPPKNPSIEVILDQNLETEKFAIKRFEELANMTDGKDHATHQMALFILNEERAHVKDMIEEMRKIVASSKEYPLGV